MLEKIVISKKIKIRTNQPDCVLIFDPEKDFFHELNSTASEIFLMIHKKFSENKITSFMIEKYDITIDEAKKYLKELVNDLVKLGVLQLRKGNKKNEKR